MRNRARVLHSRQLRYQNSRDTEDNPRCAGSFSAHVIFFSDGVAGMDALIGHARKTLLIRVGKFAAILLLILIVSGSLFTIISPFFGWRNEVVISGSMEPAIRTGSVVIVQPNRPEDIRTGDIVMYSSPDRTSLTTHRVVKIDNDPGLRFVTKGDANNNPDIVPIQPDQIVGSVAFTIPFLGYLAQFVRTPLGFILFFLAPAVVLIGSEVLHLWGEME
jgi:signal peptidase